MQIQNLTLASLMAAIFATSIALPATSALAEEQMRKITLTATGNAAAAPDLATISLAVQREAATAREALDANNAAMEEVLGAMKASGIEDKDLQTSGFNIQPVYQHVKNQPPKITGYRVHNNISVRIRDLTQVGEIMDKSITLGVNSGGHINFGHQNSDALVEEARKNAVARALKKAETLTSAAGATLGNIVHISEESRGRPRPMKMERMAMTMAAADGAPAVPIAAGETGYNVTVRIEWALE